MKLPRLERPKLSRPAGPKLGGGGPKAPNLRRPRLLSGGPSIQTPQFVSDFGRDLRDRHLLIPVIALLVALVAVPVLMTREGEPPPAPAAEPLSGAADAVAPAVLVENVGVRDYERRLDALKRRNPFNAPDSLDLAADAEAQSAGVPVSGGAAPSDAAVPLGGSEGLPSSDSLSLESPGGAPAETPPIDSTAPGTETETGDEGGDGSGGGGSDGDSKPPEPEIVYVDRIYRTVVNATVGEAGGQQRRVRDLGTFQPLPSSDNPAAYFIGVTENLRSAAFLLSDDTISRGEGRCMPSLDDCQWLLLGPQETAVLEYQPGVEPPRSYELRVDSINRVKEQVRNGR